MLQALPTALAFLAETLQLILGVAAKRAAGITDQGNELRWVAKIESDLSGQTGWSDAFPEAYFQDMPHTVQRSGYPPTSVVVLSLALCAESAPQPTN